MAAGQRGGREGAAASMAVAAGERSSARGAGDAALSGAGKGQGGVEGAGDAGASDGAAGRAGGRARRESGSAAAPGGGRRTHLRAPTRASRSGGRETPAAELGEQQPYGQRPPDATPPGGGQRAAWRAMEVASGERLWSAAGRVVRYSTNDTCHMLAVQFIVGDEFPTWTVGECARRPPVSEP